MSRLSALLVAAAVAGTSASPARAQERAAPAPASAPGRAAWTLDGRVGYAAAWTTGVSHLGLGEGLALGRTSRSGLHLELQAFHFGGQTVAAGNATLRYAASYRSTAAQAAVGYELGVGIVRLRPGVAGGLSLIRGRTELGTTELHDDDTRWTFGPSLACFVRLSRLHFGVDAQALFVPAAIAAPSLGLFGLFGAEL